MASTRLSPAGHTPTMFRALFAQWHARSGALSALPDAPVVPADPRPRRLSAITRIRLPRPATRDSAARTARTAPNRRGAATACAAPSSPAEWTAC
jgi:hypothetical protein